MPSFVPRAAASTPSARKVAQRRYSGPPPEMGQHPGDPLLGWVTTVSDLPVVTHGAARNQALRVYNRRFNLPVLPETDHHVCNTPRVMPTTLAGLGAVLSHLQSRPGVVRG